MSPTDLGIARLSDHPHGFADEKDRLFAADAEKGDFAVQRSRNHRVFPIDHGSGSIDAIGVGATASVGGATAAASVAAVTGSELLAKLLRSSFFGKSVDGPGVEFSRVHAGAVIDDGEISGFVV